MWFRLSTLRNGREPVECGHRVEFFAKQNAESYSAGIHKLIPRYDNSLNEQGDYVEK